jgi:hypothetical protein
LEDRPGTHVEKNELLRYLEQNGSPIIETVRRGKYDFDMQAMIMATGREH